MLSSLEPLGARGTRSSHIGVIGVAKRDPLIRKAKANDRLSKGKPSAHLNNVEEVFDLLLTVWIGFGVVRFIGNRFGGHNRFGTNN